MVTPTNVSFSISGKEAREMAPYLRVWPDKGEGIGAVYGMVQVISGPPNSVSAIVWEAIEEGLGAPRRLTTTRHMQNAIQGAKETLAGYAVRGWRASATLAAVSKNDLYLAWAGPTANYVITDNDIIHPGLISADTLAASGALGEEGDVQIHVAHEEMAAGDVFLMAWSRLTNIVDEVDIAPLVRSGVEPASRSLYRMASDEGEFALMLLKFGAGDGNARA